MSFPLPLSPRVRGLCRLAPAVWLCALLGSLPACDAFLVSVCQFEDRPGCHTSDASQPSAKDGEIEPPAKVSTFRRFEWRAKLELNANTRFVGLDGVRPVLLRTDDKTQWWEAYKQDPSIPADQPTIRLLVEPKESLINYPSLPLDNFSKDRFYRTNSGFYLFKYSDSNNRSITPKSSQLDAPIQKLIESPNVRPFISVDTDTFMTEGEQRNRINAKYTNKQHGDWQIDVSGYSQFVIGDLDYIDKALVDNGMDALAFSGKDLVFLRHQYSIVGINEDPSLLAGIRDAMAEASKTDTGPVQAAYISNINADEFPDLLFIRGGRVRVISYKGRRWLGFATAFEVWKEEVVAPIVGETAQYMALADLTQDGKPDLIVETDKAVHFYMNIAK